MALNKFQVANRIANDPQVDTVLILDQTDTRRYHLYPECHHIDSNTADPIEKALESHVVRRALLCNCCSREYRKRELDDTERSNAKTETVLHAPSDADTDNESLIDHHYRQYKQTTK